MCSDDCKCYAGAYNETQKMWEDYGDEAMLPFFRNAQRVKTDYIPPPKKECGEESHETDCIEEEYDEEEDEEEEEEEEEDETVKNKEDDDYHDDYYDEDEEWVPIDYTENTSTAIPIYPL